VIVRLVMSALVGATLFACPADGLFRVGERDADVDDPLRVDSGMSTFPDASTLPDASVAPDASVGTRKIVWIRAPSSGAMTEGSGRKISIRLPPPTSHGSASGVEHEIGSVLSGRAQGGNR